MKIESIRLDLFDCTGKDEKRFRVHGFDDMLDTNYIDEVLLFIADQACKLLIANKQDKPPFIEELYK